MSTGPRLTRRAALCGMASVSFATGAMASEGAAPVAMDLVFGRIVVDTARVAAFGNAAAAQALEAALSQELGRVFADRIAPGRGRATLLVRIQSLYFTPYAGGRDYGGRDSSGSGRDALDGTGLVLEGSRVLSSTPILATLEPGYSGAWYLADIDARRMASITHQFAWWLRREMGL